MLPALVLSGLMLGALGMLMSSVIKQLENFAGVMNFVIFPMFFASSALYPLWRVQEGSPLLYYICQLNPFTHAVELIRFALYGKINWLSLAVVCRLHGAVHGRRDPGLRSVARLHRAARRAREATHETCACVLAVAGARDRAPGAAFAADPRYPDWPCKQTKVPEISVAAVWAGPPIDDADEAGERPEVRSSSRGWRRAARRSRMRRRRSRISSRECGRAPRRRSSCLPAFSRAQPSAAKS